MQTAEAAVAVGPWQAMYTLSVTVAAVDIIVILLCLLLLCTGRSVAGAVAAYTSVTLMCMLVTTGGMWMLPNKVQRTHPLADMKAPDVSRCCRQACGPAWLYSSWP